MDKPRTTYLLEQYCNQSLILAEREELTALVHQQPDTELLEVLELLSQKASGHPYETTITDLQPAIDRILELDKKEIVSPDQQLIPLFRKWRYIAAILMLAIGAGVYYLNNQSSKLPAIIGGTGGTVGTRGDVAPGTNLAILTLSNGTQKELTLADNGLQLQSDAVLLTTPKGGQYQAKLPDGSKIWLNAASSIKFPSKFTDKERRVEVTGEVYFEIAKDASKPFKVTAGEQEIEVLGTAFNINIYNDEPVKKTTLITGSIKITSNNQTAIVQPGQQANISILEIPKIRLIPVQTNDVIAWKNGLFNIDRAELKTVLRQLARWYNLTIQYDENLTPKYFQGELDRGLTLQQALKILSQIQPSVSFKLNGNVLTVTQQ